jgi:hypothetical protein
MLASGDFIVGTFAKAAPLSLVLPRTTYEAAAIIGAFNDAPTAVILSGDYAFRTFKSADNDTWRGLIVPGVRIEVDETSLFDPDYEGLPVGSIVRAGTDLAVHARAESSAWQTLSVALHTGLAPTDLKAGFGRWQIVVGTGTDKRVLWRVPALATHEEGA